MSDLEAARDIALGEFGEWGERGRIAVNVATVYRTIDPQYRAPNVVEMFKRIAALER